MLKLNQQVRIQVDDVFIQYHIFDVNQPVMVTFSPYSEPITEEQISSGKSAWGFELFAKRQLNVVAFNHIGKNNIFESQIFEAFLVDFGKQLTLFPSRIGYGASLGGFAVALYAKTLGLDRALLLMPVSTFNQSIAPWEPKTFSHSRGVGLDASGCTIPLTIIYDPLFVPDKLHKERFASCVKVLTITGVGHRVLRALRDLNMLSSVVLEYREGDINSDNFYQRTRNRRNLSYYFKHIRTVNTGKLTNKRLMIIYRHKLAYHLKNLDVNPKKIITKLKVSLSKKVIRLMKIFRLQPLRN
ncbi:hypothetical protein Q4591_13030 [Shewanella sp. 3_MG-2023]|uniref:hypothetical protein n=1 Tax=Shewanella sp. 3_MG-2023 TaxID=3062635 RepID=UPI0026E2DF3D|nr:hypothetical protein [Shewanella sp. 3_MG-2023]MDO6776282.1 hypothetical protein [Shewanella sp. 3_MG-2023]